MSKLRASRTPRTRLVGAAATVVLAALSLTACDDGTGAHDEGAATAGTSSAGAGSTASPDTTASAGTSGSSGSGSDAGSSGARPAPGSTTATHAPAPEAPVSSGEPVTCEGSVTRTVAAPVNRPVNHMLLTVTNTGSRSCFLYGYPAVRFGEAQAVAPAIGESRPQAVVTLAPGESGYASVSLSATDGSGSNGHTATSLTVYFHGRSGNESVGTGADPSLPAKGVYVDDSLKVTYWQQSMDDALTW